MATSADSPVTDLEAAACAIVTAQLNAVRHPFIHTWAVCVTQDSSYMGTFPQTWDDLRTLYRSQDSFNHGTFGEAVLTVSDKNLDAVLTFDGYSLPSPSLHVDILNKRSIIRTKERALPDHLHDVYVTGDAAIVQLLDAIVAYRKQGRPDGRVAREQGQSGSILAHAVVDYAMALARLIATHSGRF